MLNRRGTIKAAFYLSIFMAISFGTSYLFKTLVGARDASNVKLVPYSTTVTVDRPTLLEGDIGVAHVTLTNHLDQEMAITAVGTSCGCMGLDRAKDRVDRVPPKGEWSVVVKVDSTFRTGKHTYRVLLAIDRGGRPEEHDVPFEFTVTPGWRTLPGSVELQDLTPGQSRTVELEVADAFPDAGIKLDHLEFSGPGTRGVTWRPIPLDQPARTFTDSNGYTFRVRGHIGVRLEADSHLEVSHGEVVAIPADSARHRLEIPVTLQLRPRPVTATPETMVFGPKLDDGHLKKRLYLKRSEQEKRALRIVNPQGITTQTITSPEPSLDAYEVIVDAKAIQATPDLAIRVVAAEDQELLRVPVKILGEGFGNERP